MTRNKTAGFVVVGYDGHWPTAHLLPVAAQEALRRDASLAIVTLVRQAADDERSQLGLRAELARAEDVVEHQLAAAAADLVERYPGLDVTTHCLPEDEVTRTRTPLASATLLVVGARGEYGKPAFGLVSISRVLLKAAHCPVLVVPEAGAAARPSSGRRPVVVAGIGEHPADAVVARAACAETFRRECDVELLHAFTRRPDETSLGGLRRARDVVHRAKEGAPAAAGTDVSILLTEEPAALALLAAADGAALVVIGSRPGALAGLVLESVSRQVLDSAPCPMLVIPRELGYTPDVAVPAGVVAAQS